MEPWELLREADQRLADERERHHRDLREADQRAIDLLQSSNNAHFERLNENMARTIEERTHFLSVEGFAPWQAGVDRRLAERVGVERGTTLTMERIVTGVSLFIAIAAVVLSVVN